MEDWEKNPNKYLTDAQGNYILKKDGTPQKKRGRPKNSELSDVRAALHAQKALKKKNSKVTKLRRSLKKAEKEFETKMKELDVDLYKLETQEKQDARKTFSKDWTARIIGIAMVGGFLGYIFLVTLQPPEQNSEALINLVLGYLGGLASAVISFYFGASNKQE